MVSNIPTDNLYKFLALSGVFLFCFGVYFVSNQSYTLREKVHEESLLTAEWSARVEHLAKEVELLRGTISNTRKQRRDKHISDVVPRDKEMTRLIENVRIQALESEIATRKMEVSSSYIDELIAKNSWYVRVALIWMIVSGAMAVIGFYLWFVKVQKPLDAAALNAGKEHA